MLARFVSCSLAAVVVATLAACAQPEQKAAETYSPPVTRTGSNIPVGRERDSKPTEMSEAERRQVEQMIEQSRGVRGRSN